MEEARREMSDQKIEEIVHLLELSNKSKSSKKNHKKAGKNTNQPTEVLEVVSKIMEMVNEDIDVNSEDGSNENYQSAAESLPEETKECKSVKKKSRRERKRDRRTKRGDGSGRSNARDMEKVERNGKKEEEKEEEDDRKRSSPSFCTKVSQSLPWLSLTAMLENQEDDLDEKYVISSEEIKSFLQNKEKINLRRQQLREDLKRRFAAICLSERPWKFTN